MRLEQLQEEAITQNLAATAPIAAQMTDAEREASLALLPAPDLVDRVLADLTACGLVGEEANKLVGYLAVVSRLLDRPLGVVIQSSSAAGKTSLMDAVLAFVPDEDKVKYSAMTGQSLFYMGETNLKHKALAIVEEERREPRQLCVEAVAIRRRTDDGQHRQRPGHRQPGDAALPRRRPVALWSRPPRATSTRNC